MVKMVVINAFWFADINLNLNTSTKELIAVSEILVETNIATSFRSAFSTMQNLSLLQGFVLVSM